MQSLLDRNVIEAVANYIKYGYHPGGFAMQILLGNNEESYKYAHELLKDHISGQDIVANTIKFVNKMVPLEAYGNTEKVRTWIEHKGLHKASEDTKVMVHIEYPNTWWERYSL